MLYIRLLFNCNRTDSLKWLSFQRVQALRVWINLVLLNLQFLTCIILWPNRINLTKWVMKSYLNPSPAILSKHLPSHCCKTKRFPLIIKYRHSKVYNRQAECLLRGMKWIFVYNINQFLSFKTRHGWGRQSLDCNSDVLGSIPGQSVWDCGGESRSGTSFSPKSLVFPCQYLFINAPYSSLSTCCFCQKDKRTNTGNILKNDVLLEIGENSILSVFRDTNLF